ncbi:MAG: prolipoprotein diacylglyceryl transferase [Bacteroidota bacterium]
MRQILFSLFGLPIYAYGTALALGFLIAIVLATREAAKKGVSPETIVDIALCLCLGGLVGARITYVLLEFGYYAQHPLEILNIKAGGLSFYGGAVVAFATAWWYAKKKRLEPWPIADIVTPYVPLGYAIVRLGCFLNGCCYGLPSHVPWALACKDGDPYTLRHPTQLYAAAASFLLFLLLYRLRNHRRFPGFLFFLYMGLYAIVRGIIEAFREDQILFAEVRTTQVVCLIAAAYAAAVIWRREKRRLQTLRLEVDGGEEVGRGA